MNSKQNQLGREPKSWHNRRARKLSPEVKMRKRRMKRHTKTFWIKLPKPEQLVKRLTWMGMIKRRIKKRIQIVENVTATQVKMKVQNQKATEIRRDQEIEVEIEIGTEIETESAGIPMTRMIVLGVKRERLPPRKAAIGRGMEMITKNQEEKIGTLERMRSATVVTKAKKKGRRIV